MIPHPSTPIHYFFTSPMYECIEAATHRWLFGGFGIMVFERVQSGGVWNFAGELAALN